MLPLLQASACCSIGCNTCDGGAVVVVGTTRAAGNGPPAVSTHSIDVEHEEEKQKKSSNTMHIVGLHSISHSQSVLAVTLRACVRVGGSHANGVSDEWDAVRVLTKCERR